jgi:RNA polymerase sigma-70 factor (ECF subfamily)
MSDASDSQTSTSLLRRLRQEPTDQAAWGAFVDRYGGMIYQWCRRWGLQPADAEDVAQNVLLDLARQMRTFVYDPQGSFRRWLKTVAYRSWCHLIEDYQRPGHGPGNHELLDHLKSDAACADFLQELENESDRELLEHAMRLVRVRVQRHTWEAFRLTALEELPAAVVAERLQINVGTVFVARSKVQKMLQQEIRRLQPDEPE